MMKVILNSMALLLILTAGSTGFAKPFSYAQQSTDVDYFLDDRFSDDYLRTMNLSTEDYQKVVAIKNFIEKRISAMTLAGVTYNVSADPYIQYYTKQMDHVLKQYQNGWLSINESQELALKYLRGFFRWISKDSPKNKKANPAVSLGIRG